MEIEETFFEFIPKNTEIISEEEKKKIYEKLFEELDDQEEVKDIYSTINFNFNNNKNMKILGFDPGTKRLGHGLINCSKNKMKLLNMVVFNQNH
jgi:hypothetical protein